MTALSRIMTAGAFVALSLSFAAGSFAAENEAPSTGGYESESAEDRMVREIAQDLRCAVCQNESVAVSNSQLARSMRALIREQVQTGKNADEIRAYFVSRYGDYILMEPRKTGRNLFLWAFPFVALAIGALFITFRFVRKGGGGDEVNGPPTATTEETDALIRRLREPGGDKENTEKKS